MEIGAAARAARSSRRGHVHPRDGHAANAARRADSRRGRPLPPRSPVLAFRHHTWARCGVRKLCVGRAARVCAGVSARVARALK